jgi:hypothetical protein
MRDAMIDPFDDRGIAQTLWIVAQITRDNGDDIESLPQLKR